MAYGFNDDKSKSNLNDLFVTETISVNQAVNISANGYDDISFVSAHSSNDYKIISILDFNPAIVIQGTTTYAHGACVLCNTRVFTNNSLNIRLRNVTNNNVTIGTATKLTIILMKIN